MLPGLIKRRDVEPRRGVCRAGTPECVALRAAKHILRNECARHIHVN